MKKVLIILAILLCITLGGGIIWANNSADKTGPNIIFPAGEITYEEGNKEALLEGVIATDNVDGDVSDSIRVNGVFPNTAGDKANILYVAKDKSNNISKTTREVVFIAKDVEESSMIIDEDMQEESTVAEPIAEPTAMPEISVTPGASVTPAPSITPAAAGGAPVITLTDSEVTVRRGASVNRLVYVQSITDDKDDRSELYRGIQIIGEVDTTTVGEYELIYYVVDSDGNRSNEAEMVIIVE